MLKKIFLKLLWERKNDYIRVILSGIFCISVIFFSAAVGSGLVYISVGKKASMTELVMEVEKNFIIPYVLSFLFQPDYKAVSGAFCRTFLPPERQSGRRKRVTFGQI